MGTKPKKASKSTKTKKPAKATASGKLAKRALPPPVIIDSTLAFFLDDYSRTLFPMRTNRELIVRGEKEIKEYINKCLDESEKAYSFLSQKRVYAAKPNSYLRRTIKLDPVAEYYLYDVVFRNRSLFRKPHTAGRTHYGYRFEGGVPIAPTEAYKAFKSALAEYSSKYSHSMGFDVASYFNGVYHHDLVSWFSELGASLDDANGLGKLLRQINSGRSIDCLPQGIYPTKMIGNDFLRFIDNYYEISSEKFVRFMDDMYLFSDEKKDISDDFQIIQRLLGDKGLSVNPQKTSNDSAGHIDMENKIDSVKKSLLKRRRILIHNDYNDDEPPSEFHFKKPLSEDELKYINEILDKPNIEEDDAELILTIMRDNAHRVERRLPEIIMSYPNLAKTVYGFCAGVKDKELIADIILGVLRGPGRLTEFQLFWFGSILEEYLMDTSKVGSLISALFNHRSTTSITKAKVLEIDDARFGLPELRNEFLISGQSDWLAWSSAVGSSSLTPATRNHRLKYFGNSSQINHLIANIMLKV
ncbi:antiviral reverse transcriptase Drt5 [Mesorhizobium carmichaelinearum]|uniref:antiviral reverse transcriptase Drt5 n=1 Tax=Mesorhizobium carmichaelinearum TaxID=1208188 RepID=UPI0018E09E9A|nr:antiviral reverse transcriptase Drt5 [Mesorhizobium carmichaelinearum]